MARPLTRDAMQRVFIVRRRGVPRDQTGTWRTAAEKRRLWLAPLRDVDKTGDTRRRRTTFLTAATRQKIAGVIAQVKAAARQIDEAQNLLIHVRY